MGRQINQIFPASWNVLTQSSGGLEILFSNQSKHNIALPAKNKDGSPANMKALVTHLCENTMTDHRKELFVLKADDGYEV